VGNNLPARSPVFRAMLRQKEMTEKQEGIVEMTDVSAEALEHLLAFIYTGGITTNRTSGTKDLWVKLLPELVYMADKVRIDLFII